MTLKELRYSIMKIATGKYKWDYSEFHDLMDDWGYGRSLRKLSKNRLFKLKNELLGITNYDVPDEFKLDKQGLQMYGIMIEAGLKIADVNMFCTKRFKKTHWNILNETERRGVIAMLRNYCK